MIENTLLEALKIKKYFYNFFTDLLNELISWWWSKQIGLFLIGWLVGFKA